MLITKFVEVPNTNIQEEVLPHQYEYDLLYSMAQESETQTDSWSATEICLALSDIYGYAETLDAWGKHCGEYGDRPVALGQRVF